MAAPIGHGSYLSVILKLLLLASLLAGASFFGDWVVRHFDAHLTPSTEPSFHRMVMIASVVYVFLMALPFVPGVEIGLGLIAMFGPNIVPLVYACTVLALMLAFLVGRLVPQQRIVRIFEAVHLRRAANLLRQLEPLDSNQRLGFLLQNTSSKVVPFLIRHRFLALVAVLNLPGNALIGGGGGICLIAGFSRLFSFASFSITVALAVSPIPLMVLLGSSLNM